MESLVKKSKKKKFVSFSNDEEDEFSEQSRHKKKSKKERNENAISETINENRESPKKKNKKNKNDPNSIEENDVIVFNIEDTETEDDKVGKPKKSKKKDKEKRIEENVFNQGNVVFNIEETETEDDKMGKPKKNKKKNKRISIDREDVFSQNLHSPKEDCIDLTGPKDEVDAQSCISEHDVVTENKETDWETSDYMELITRMENQIPKNDHISFTCRADRLDWSKIKFGDYTTEECKSKWKVLKTKVRHYRLLNEVLQDAKVWAQDPWSSANHKNNKRQRHPEQPAKPLTSYMIFYLEKKNKIMKRNPNLKLPEISRILGEKYKALSEEKRAYYKDRAEQLKEEYKIKLDKFHEKYPQYAVSRKKEAVVKKRSAKAQRPLPPFKLYLKEKLKQHQDSDNFNLQEFTEKYKEVWKTLGKKKKAFWIRMAKEEEDKFLDELQELHNEGPTIITYKSIISKEDNNILDRAAGKPEKPPNSAYGLFSKLMLQNKDNFDGEPKNRMKDVATKWKEITAEQRQAYAEEVQHMHDNYKLAFANYLESLPEEKRAEELAKVQPKKRPVKARTRTVTKGYESSQAREEYSKNRRIEPEKPPVTAWDLYKNEYFNKNSHLPSNVVFEKAAATWKNLPAKEIEKFKRKHEQMKEKYLVDYEAFLKRLTPEELKEYYTLKGNATEELNEESLEDESSSEEEDSEDDSDSESDSGVSEGLK